MNLLRQNTLLMNAPVLLIFDDWLVDGEPEKFIYGHRLEYKPAKGKWRALSEPEQEGEKCVRVRLSTGELVFMHEWPYEGEKSGAGQQRDRWMEQTDGICHVMPLPEGLFRLAGVQLTRAQLMSLLPCLHADLEGVLVISLHDCATYHFWTVGGESGKWSEYNCLLGELAEQHSGDGPHFLYRLTYEDPIRPGMGRSLEFKTGYCVGYFRAVPGPLALVPVEIAALSAHWPVEVLYDVLSEEALVEANLKPGPNELL